MEDGFMLDSPWDEFIDTLVFSDEVEEPVRVRVYDASPPQPVAVPVRTYHTYYVQRQEGFPLLLAAGFLFGMYVGRNW